MTDEFGSQDRSETLAESLYNQFKSLPKVVALQQPQVNVAKAAKSTPEELELLAEGLYNKFKSLPED
jgi:hypothetical protein